MKDFNNYIRTGNLIDWYAYLILKDEMKINNKKLEQIIHIFEEDYGDEDYDDEYEYDS